MSFGGDMMSMESALKGGWDLMLSMLRIASLSKIANPTFNRYWHIRSICNNGKALCTNNSTFNNRYELYLHLLSKHNKAQQQIKKLLIYTVLTPAGHYTAPHTPSHVCNSHTTHTDLVPAPSSLHPHTGGHRFSPLKLHKRDKNVLFDSIIKHAMEYHSLWETHIF